MRIGEVARRSGMSISRIRYYEARGVLTAPERISGRRHYTPDVMRRLAVIDVAQRVGFTLDEIRALPNSDGPAHEQLRRLAERKLPDIEKLILHATAVRRWLKMTSACDCDSLDVCSLFDDRVLSLNGHTEARAGVIVIEPPRTATPNASRPETAHR